MEPHPADAQPKTFFGFPLRMWRIAVILGLACLVCMWFSEKFLPRPSEFFPASALALSALTLEGLELWPVIFLATLVGYAFLGTSPIFLVLLPIAQTLQAFVGAYLLRLIKLDPFFRRSRDIFFLIVILLATALIVPSLTSFASFIGTAILHDHTIVSAWWPRYIGNFFCLLILTPFLVRWFAKPRFNRTAYEILEILVVFLLLIVIDYFLFIRNITLIGDVPLVYFLLIPLFWIALRMRPRFVTLAIIITSLFAITSLYFGHAVPPALLFNTRLLQIEEFILVIAIIFLIIASLEEDRRLNSNLMRSQMATLENAVARISSESNAKNDFIAVLAHELRNPLAPVVSAIDFLKMDTGRSQDEVDTLVMMEDRMNTVRRLLDDLLDISRISEGKLALKKQSVDLQTIIRRAIISTTHHIRERHQSLTFKAPEEKLRINGDPVRIEQIFSNLITNASKYSDPGDQITISIQKRETSVEIAVSDTGIGIRPEVIEKIFTPFHQVDLGARTKKGLGIGLALVKSFVEMHDGSIHVSSEGPGKGSRFTVVLPLLRSQSTADSQSETFSPSIQEPAFTHEKVSETRTGPRVLVVDDNDAAAWGMGKLLEMKGCIVSYAYDGKQAIDEAAKVSPDIILLDIGLPDQDGYAVAKTLRARGFHGRLIALTGYSTEDARTKGSEAGFEHYLTKPAGLAELKRVIPEIS